MSFRTLALCTALLLLGAAAAWAESTKPAPIRATAAGGTPVVVELFSSEGCSSCPPADKFLRDFEKSGSWDGALPLVLEYHVDYWNYLGWRDPFSRAEFTERQEKYSAAFADKTIYTPEIVVQGRSTFAGQIAATLRDRLRREAAESAAHVVVHEDGAWITIHVDGANAASVGEPTDVLVAVTESDLHTDVTAGENRGEHLTHAPVVRRLTSIGTVSTGTFDARVPAELEPTWKPEHVRFVAFVQGRSSRRIYGAGCTATVPSKNDGSRP